MQNKAVTLISPIMTLLQIACFPYKALAFIYIIIQFLVCLVKEKGKQDSTTSQEYQIRVGMNVISG